MAMPNGTAETGDGAIDFLVIGAMKAGTTSLFEYLRGHPEIDLPPDKEVPYFNDDRIYGQLTWDEYLRRAFPAPKRGRLAGTVTPVYMSPIARVSEADADGRESPSAGYDNYTLPRRIHEQLPSARLIAILRDPVERAYSHYVEATRRSAENRPFATALDDLLQPDALTRTRSQLMPAGGYVVLGEYGRLLEGYYDLFPRERLLVLFTRDLAREPLNVLRRIYDFLGVAPDVEPRNLGKRYNVGSAEFKIRPGLPAAMVRRASDNPVAHAVWHSLSAKRRSTVLGAYRRFNFRFRDWNRRTPTSAAEPSAEVVAALERLRDHYADDEQLLEKLLGYSPPWGISGETPLAATEDRAAVDWEATRK
jgi:Sulfotransferase domain